MSIKNNFEKTVRLSYLDKERLSREIDLHAGYRYVHYIEDERAEGDENPIGTVYLLGYSKKDGSRTCFEISDYPLILWERTDIAEDENSWHDSYGKPIVKKTFDSELSRRKYVKALKGLENYVERQVVCCDKPTDQFMKEVFLPEAISAEANQGKLRTFYIDIETEISGAFMPPHISANRINMITVLLEQGYAYEAGGNVYFDTSKLEQYYRFHDFKEEDLEAYVAGRLVAPQPAEPAKPARPCRYVPGMKVV